MFYILDVADSTLCEGVLVPNVLFNVVFVSFKCSKFYCMFDILIKPNI